MIDPAVLLALGALVCNGLADIVYKRAATAGVRPHHLMMVQSSCYGVLVLAYAVISGTLVLDRASLIGAVAGVFAFTGFYNFARSLQGGAVTVNAPIFRLSFTITAVLAVLLLGEPVTTAKIAGLAFALLAVWLLLGARAADVSLAAISRASLRRVLVATVTVGIANLLYKVGMQAGATPAGLLTVQACVVISLSFIFVRFAEGKLAPPPATWRFALPAAVLLSSAFVLLVEGLARGEASTLVPIAQLGFVVTAILGITVLREPLTRRKGVGLLAATLALACLALA
jgi:drug/metabolite transporter (DMT)-like permease